MTPIHKLQIALFALLYVVLARVVYLEVRKFLRRERLMRRKRFLRQEARW